MRLSMTATKAALLLASLTTTAAEAAELIQNGSFEATTTAASAGSIGSFAYPGGTFDGWTYASSGLIDGDTASAWFGGSPPQGFIGAQYAFLQANSALSQTFTADATGTLALSWLEAGRPDSAFYSGAQTYTVAIGSSLLGTFSSVPNQPFTARSASPFAVVAGSSYTLTFQGLSQTDNTAFLDAVSASVTAPVPEPGEWAMLVAGLAIVGGVARRRRSKA